jgi:hypothetical protein
MPSAAKVKFETILARADLLCKHAAQIKTKAEGPTKVVLLHAALANQVAAWDAYIKALSLEYFLVTSSPADIRFSTVHELLKAQLEVELKKFNTPNSENCRNLLLRYAKFDPWPAWLNINFKGGVMSSSILVRNVLDEILKLRHSFAHGFSIPAHSWNIDSSGAATLNCPILGQTRRFLVQVCERTDNGLSAHIASQHGIPKPW